MMTKSWETNETVANGYPSDSAQQELFNIYQHDWIKMICCFFVHWMKVTSASEEFKG